MDIVIPLGTGSKHNNLELRYALRSIEKYFPDRGHIFLVGERPEFIHKVIHIQAHDNPGSQWKEQNIFSKIIAAVQDPRITDDFVLFNDDHFLLKEFTGKYFSNGTLADSLASRTIHESYANTIRNTMQAFPEGLDYDVHCPMVMNRERFLRTVACASWHIPFGYSIQSLYGNLLAPESDWHPDCKLRYALPSEKILKMIARWDFFSISDESLNKDMELTLEALYPIKSVYEL